MASAAPAQVAKAVVTATNERSFLRNVVPLRVAGPGPVSTLLRHAFLHQDCLIVRFLGALEQVPLPALPRMLLAEGFQQLLEGTAPQREVRDMFEEAELECRRYLWDLSDTTPLDGLPPEERSARLGVLKDPLMRLLAYELRAACGYYARVTAISTNPWLSASVLMRTLVASDVRADPLLSETMLQFEGYPRDAKTGLPPAGMPPPPSTSAEFVKEMLLLERDAFGRFRFDARGDNRHLSHCIKLSDVAKTPDSFSFLANPVLKENGNFVLDSTAIHSGRWMEHKLSCGEEDHRIDAALPDLETITTTDELTGAPLTFTVHYNEPICQRHKETTKEKNANVAHVEVIELAIEDTNRTLMERWFMDR